MRFRSIGPLAFRRLSVFPLLLATLLPPLAWTQTPDRSALRLVAERFFDAYQREDLAALMLLWSEKSPDFAQRKQGMQQLFESIEKIELKRLEIRNVSIEGENGIVRVIAQISGEDMKTGRPAPELGLLDRTFKCVKEGELWKIWQYGPSADLLANDLVAANTEQQRSALLVQYPDLVTSDMLRSLERRIERLMEQGGYEQARDLLRLDLRIAEQIGDKTGIVTSWRGIGTTHMLQGNYSLALEHYEKSLKAAEAMGSKLEFVTTFINIGAMHYALSHYTEAVSNLEKALQLAEELDNKALVLQALGNLGLIRKAQGDYDGALDYYRKSLELAERYGKTREITAILTNIANIHFSRGDYQQALDHHQRALKLDREIDNKAGIVRGLANVGLVFDSRGDSSQALDYFQQSLNLAEQLKHRQEVAGILLNIGNVYHRQGRFSKALNNYQAALNRSEELGQTTITATAVNNIGNIYRSQGDDRQALNHYRRSLDLAEKLKIKREIVVALNNIGGVYSTQGDYREALNHYRKALSISEGMGEKARISAALKSIGDTFAMQANYHEALEYYGKALKIAEAIGRKSGVAGVLLSMSKVQSSNGDDAISVQLAEQAALIAKEIGSQGIFWEAKAAAGKAYRRLQSIVSARQSFADAISALEQLREQVAGSEQEREQFFESRVSPYYAMADLLIGDDRIEEALGYIERAKGRVLADVLQGGRTDVTKTLTADELERELVLNREIISLNAQVYRESQRLQPNQARLADLRTRLDKARLEREAFQTGLYAAHPEVKVQRGSVQPLNLRQAGGLMPDAKTALLEFAVLEDKILLFVLTKETRSGKDGADLPQLKLYQIKMDRKELASRVEEFGKRLAQRNLNFRAPAADLYRLLLKPAEAQLRGKTTLCVVPDDALWNLPFQALETHEHRYLIQDRAIFYVSSLTVLNEMSKLGRMSSQGRRKPLSKRETTLVAFGNPALEAGTKAEQALRSASRNALPQAEREVRTLQELYGQLNSRVYTGADATEQMAKETMDGGTVLHFATHGILDDRSPMYSRLVLSQAQKGVDEDGLLEAWEVIKLDLHADMAVLSACETARGRIGAGEGVIGMAWAFFIAGCPTMVVSQWAVDSDSTTELMLEFHRNIVGRAGGRPATSKAEALRLAALKLLSDDRYSHPFYWAGLAAIGDAGGRTSH